MPIAPRPAAEIVIDPPLVRALLESQHPDLAHLPLSEAAEGWDNTLYRVGDELAVRLPRRQAAAALIEHEQRWLPFLRGRLTLPVPTPRRAGRPGCGFPWSWSVIPWFKGQSALLVPPGDSERAATTLGGFLRALHEPAPGDAPKNQWRGGPLDSRTDLLEQHLCELEGIVDRDDVRHTWDRALAAAPWKKQPLWIHGDLHPGNLLIHDDRLSAVIDFGDLTAGDPATDLSVMWMLFPAEVRAAFVEVTRSGFDPIDDDTLLRARGWALALGLAYMARSADDPQLAALGRRTVHAALST